MKYPPACGPPSRRLIARVEEGRVLLDLRTVFPEQDTIVIAALTSSVSVDQQV